MKLAKSERGHELKQHGEVQYLFACAVGSWPALRPTRQATAPRTDRGVGEG